MNDNLAGSFFIELGAVFNPKGFDDAQKKVKETNADFSNSFETLNNKTSAYSTAMGKFVTSATSVSAGSMQKFFDSSSKGFLNLESLTKNIFNNILSSFTSMIAQMMLKSTLSGIAGMFGGGGGILGGVLGSRQTGGPIPLTGRYLLHEGEYVLPKDVVGAIKSNSAPSGSSSSAPEQQGAQGIGGLGGGLILRLTRL
ncbi:phage-related minor tail protein [Elusimicrobium posterum]|uniref:hypothetical protein n=1 Tax=Elusimicrobium posterum TaxID=3116653 RepID=UPI003C75D9B9